MEAITANMYTILPVILLSLNNRLNPGGTSLERQDMSAVGLSACQFSAQRSHFLSYERKRTKRGAARVSHLVAIQRLMGCDHETRRSRSIVITAVCSSARHASQTSVHSSQTLSLFPSLARMSFSSFVPSLRLQNRRERPMVYVSATKVALGWCRNPY